MCVNLYITTYAYSIYILYVYKVKYREKKYNLLISLKLVHVVGRFFVATL